MKNKSKHTANAIEELILARGYLLCMAQLTGITVFKEVASILKRLEKDVCRYGYICPMGNECTVHKPARRKGTA